MALGPHTLVELNPGMALFTTCNPTYMARQRDMPSNIKELFRPVAMMRPDYVIIAEVLLFAAGFQQARTAAQQVWRRVCTECHSCWHSHCPAGSCLPGCASAWSVARMLFLPSGCILLDGFVTMNASPAANGCVCVSTYCIKQTLTHSSYGIYD